MNAAWAINNLNKWNKINKDVLYELALYHIIDCLSLEEKINLILLVYSFNNKDAEEEAKDDKIKDTFIYKIVENFFKKCLVNINKKKEAYVVGDFNKEKKSQITYLSFEDDCLKLNSTNIIRERIVEKAIRKFKIRNKDSINEVLGSLSQYRGESVTFKIKDKTNKRNVGSVCDNTSNKKVLVEKINDILGYQKYEYPQRRITAITNSDKVKFKNDKDIKQYDGLTVVLYNKKQFCVEIELLLRYFDKIKKNNKVWFFNTIDNLYNN